MTSVVALTAARSEGPSSPITVLYSACSSGAEDRCGDERGGMVHTRRAPRKGVHRLAHVSCELVAMFGPEGLRVVGLEPLVELDRLVRKPPERHAGRLRERPTTLPRTPSSPRPGRRRHGHEHRRHVVVEALLLRAPCVRGQRPEDVVQMFFHVTTNARHGSGVTSARRANGAPGNGPPVVTPR